MSTALAHRLPPPLRREIEEALHQAEKDPARRSAILGNTALGLAAKAQRPQHQKEAPVLRALAEQIAQVAMAAQALPGPATIDDFAEQLDEFNTAHRRYENDQDVLAHADDLHDLKTAKHGARVSIAPLSWGAGATLGRTGRFKWNPSSDEILQNIAQSGALAYWQGEPHEAQAITVDLALPADFTPAFLVGPAGDVPPQTSSRAYGLVSYGSDGAITQVKFDAGFGVRFTVVGSYVSILGGMDPPITGTDAGTVSLTASIGAFSSPSVAPVFVTQYIDSLANGQATAPFSRPLHATQILPILSSATAGTALLRFYGQDRTVALFQFSYPVGQLLPPLPLPGEVQYITLTNNTGGTANFRVPFQLAL